MRIVYLFLLTLFSVNLHAQDYYLSNWLNGKRACVVLTYDDWLEGHGTIAIPQLVERDMVASFYVNTDWADISGGYDTMNYAISKGIEIGNHTVSHEDLRYITSQQQLDQINNAADSILANTTAQGGLTFAYPYGGYNSQVINTVAKKHFASRAVWGRWFWNNNWRYDFLTSNNGAIVPYHEVTTFEVTTDHSLLSIASELNNAESNGGLITLMLHEIYNSSFGDPFGYDAIDEGKHADFLDFIKSYESQFWIATFADAIKYHKERHCATLTTISDAAGLWKLNLTDTLSNNSIYFQPLTVNLTIPSTYNVTYVLQGSDTLAFEAVDAKIVFNAIPDGGEITVQYTTNNSVAELNVSQPLKEIFPVPAEDEINLIMDLDQEDYQVFVYDSEGRTVFHKSNLGSGAQVMKIDVSDLRSGVYHLQLRSSIHSNSKSFLIK